MNRRSFIAQSAIAAVASQAGAARAKAAETSAAITDCNCNLGEWPFRHLGGPTPMALAERLAKGGCSEAWVSSLDALLHRDLAAVNARLAKCCTEVERAFFKPVGSVNPKLPAWQDDMSRCAEQHGMKTVRLHPNYHGYTLDDPVFAELLHFAAEKKLAVQIAVQMEDERTQNPAMQVKPVDVKPLPEVLKQEAGARVMLLNANARMVATALAGVKNIWLDIAMLEGVGGIENLLKGWPLDRLVFGSHAPVFYWEAAKLKLQESELSAGQLRAVCSANAAAFLQA